MTSDAMRPLPMAPDHTQVPTDTLEALFLAHAAGLRGRLLLLRDEALGAVQQPGEPRLLGGPLAGIEVLKHLAAGVEEAAGAVGRAPLTVIGRTGVRR